MKLVRVSNGCEHCTVVVPRYHGDNDARKQALDVALKDEYFTHDQLPEIECTCLDSKCELTVEFDEDSEVTLRVKEWCAVYDGVIKEPIMLAGSEY